MNRSISKMIIRTSRSKIYFWRYINMYDFSKVAHEAAKIKSTDNGGGGSKEFKYKLVYPGQGKIKFRLLFNPKSGLIGRLITRHNVGGKKVLCASTYSHRDNCPICKVLKDIENMGITYPRDLNPKTRGLFFAQFISADYEVAGGNLKNGDVFILMTPYTIYKEIMKWVSDFSEDSATMAKVFGAHECYGMIIEKGVEGTDWSFRPDPNVTINSASDDDAFSEMIEGLDSLYEICGFHKEITPEEVALMQTTADGLIDSYISGSLAQRSGAPAYNPTPQATPESHIPKEDKSTPKPEPTSVATGATGAKPSDAPICWGGYTQPDDTDPAKRASRIRCQYCPDVIKSACMVASSDLPF